MKKAKRFAAILMVTILSVTLCGAGLSKNYPKLNTDENRIYDVATIEQLSSNYTEAYDNFNGHDVVVAGTVRSMDLSAGFFTFERAARFITVYFSNTSEVSGLKGGDKVWVYGTFKAAADKSYQIKLHHAVKSDVTDIEGDHRFYEGGVYSDSASVSRSISEGRVVYSIPARFAAAELSDDKKPEIFNIDGAEGNCYYLNSLEGKKEAECLCIFRFNIKKYVKYESDEKELRGIERAIISNICPDEEANLKFNNPLIFPGATSTAGYGLKFDYYVATFASHKVEFVFTPCDAGVCVIMYIYGDEPHYCEDILYVMRSLQIR